MSHFYIYAHYREDPIANPLAVPYYIGKGIGNRAFNRYSRGQYHKNIIKKYGLFVKKLHEHLTEQEAFEAECFYIKELGRLDKKTGCLINHTDGGEGASGYFKGRIEVVFAHGEVLIADGIAATQRRLGTWNLERKINVPDKITYALHCKGIGFEGYKVISARYL